MAGNSFAYFSRMFQAVPPLIEVQRHAGGTFVSSRASTLAIAKKLYPNVAVAKYGSWLSRYSQGYKVLDAASIIVAGATGRELLSQFDAKKNAWFSMALICFCPARLSRKTVISTYSAR
jgi:hypothetical protein